MANEVYRTAIETADLSLTEAKWNAAGMLVSTAIGIYAVSQAIKGYKNGHNGDGHGHAFVATLAGINTVILGKDAVLSSVETLRNQQIAVNMQNLS